MKFTLENQVIVITGEFDGLDAEDAKWDLIAKGARVLTSVSKTTAIVLAGKNPKQSVMNGAAKHRTPTFGEDVLRALMGGATIAQATSPNATQAPLVLPLTGKQVVVLGKIPRSSHAAIHASLVSLGASVSMKVTSKTDLLILGESEDFAAIDALNAGIPFLFPDDLIELERGAPYSQYVGQRNLKVDDPATYALEKLNQLREELVDLDMGGEVWSDELTLSIHSTGRLSVQLQDLGGTPTERHVRRILQREDWPQVDGSCAVIYPIVFGLP